MGVGQSEAGLIWWWLAADRSVVKPSMRAVKSATAGHSRVTICKPQSSPACRFLVQNALRLKQEAGIDFDPAKVRSDEACSSLLCSTLCLNN